jgi:hypothetical protein
MRSLTPSSPGCGGATGHRKPSARPIRAQGVLFTASLSAALRHEYCVSEAAAAVPLIM